MVVTNSPSRRKSAWPAGTRSTKIAKATCSPSPHATTRQRIRRRSRDRATPMPMIAASPSSPVSRLGQRHRSPRRRGGRVRGRSLHRRSDRVGRGGPAAPPARRLPGRPSRHQPRAGHGRAHEQQGGEQRAARRSPDASSSALRPLRTAPAARARAETHRSKAVRIMRSISSRVKPSAVWASQYSSLSVTPHMSQPSVQRVTATPSSKYSPHRMIRGAGRPRGSARCW